MSSNLTEEAKKLPVEERIALVEEIWDSIADDNGYIELTDAQKQELDRRIQSFQENPHAARNWEDIKSEFINSK
ncbi:MAG TPA: addiction module protein [Pyrinomonadaceae bacterium]|nr:addiction module protein [Pyrinomonadaceae bacterium]